MRQSSSYLHVGNRYGNDSPLISLIQRRDYHAARGAVAYVSVAATAVINHSVYRRTPSVYPASRVSALLLIKATTQLTTVTLGRVISLLITGRPCVVARTSDSYRKLRSWLGLANDAHNYAPKRVAFDKMSFTQLPRLCYAGDVILE